MTPDSTPPAVGRPQLSAVRDPLIRRLSDLLYRVGGDLLNTSRHVERRQIDDYDQQAAGLGVAFAEILIIHGQLAALDELEGGRMHGRQTATFPAPDAAVAERLASFQATRALERTQQRPWPPGDDAPEVE